MLKTEFTIVYITILLVCSEDVGWILVSCSANFQNEDIILLLVIPLLDPMDLHSLYPALIGHVVLLGDEGQHLVLARIIRAKL